MCVGVVDLPVCVSVCECLYILLFMNMALPDTLQQKATNFSYTRVHYEHMSVYLSLSLSLRTSFSVCPYVCVFICIWSLVKAKSFVLLRLSLCLNLSFSVSSACYASRSACGLVLGQLSELMQSGRTTIKAKNDDRTAN